MFKLLRSALFWGLVLVIGGALLLLDTFGVFKGSDLFWTIVAAVAGLLFLSAYVTDRRHWWVLIPGVILLALAATIGLNAFLPGFSNTNLGGVIFLGGVALTFLLVYLVEHRNWWAIIPAGIMATLAVVAGVDNITTGEVNGGIFFLGLGLTFALVAILPTAGNPMRWAWIPAVILGIFGILIMLAVGTYINYVWPSVLILAGLLLVIRVILRKGQS